MGEYLLFNQPCSLHVGEGEEVEETVGVEELTSGRKREEGEVSITAGQWEGGTVTETMQDVYERS